MAWKAYQVVLRLRSPMHIGQMKLGNIQRTRPYVTGRVLWGALTMRLTRDAQPPGNPATDSALYQNMGERVHQQLAFTYLFPTTSQDGVVDLWPWEEGFGPRFLSSYASTALTYPQQSAAEGTLHEVECITPNTLDDGRPVYLAGYLFAQEDATNWQRALNRLQLGGEQGYGWGQVELKKLAEWDVQQPLFGWYTIVPDAWPPVLKATEGARLVAHALAADYIEEVDNREQVHRAVDGIQGPVEPLVGRETRSPDGFGAYLSQAYICYAPGSLVTDDGFTCSIGPYGIWEAENIPNKEVSQ